MGVVASAERCTLEENSGVKGNSLVWYQLLGEKISL